MATAGTVNQAPIQLVPNATPTASNPLQALQQGATLPSGWYVFIACFVGILTADTKAGLVVTGILSLALLYQFNLLVQGK